MIDKSNERRGMETIADINKIMSLNEKKHRRRFRSQKLDYDYKKIRRYRCEVVSEPKENQNINSIFLREKLLDKVIIDCRKIEAPSVRIRL